MGTRGVLRIYLGAAPGVGKTYKMLGEAVRRKNRGTDIVVGLVETHGRAETIAQLADLELMPLKAIEYRGTVLREMDLDAIMARRPRVVLVDEYAHTNAPGSRNEKRWQDVQQLLDAGIDVISTLNIQHLESLNDVILRITGTTQRETVPDDVVRRADQLELVDMTSEAIRRRMAHGNIYPPERIDAALANYFRPGNLDALRELALLWVADRVEESLQSYLSSHEISNAWETRERVVVGVTGVAGGEALIRRASRMAGRVGGDLVGVYIAVDDGLSRDDPESLSMQRRLVEELGGRVHDIVGHDTAEALATFAKRQKATQLVLGATRRSRWHELIHGSFVARVTRLAGDVDIHVIAEQPTADDAVPSSPQRAAPGLDRRRVIAAWLLLASALPFLVAVTVPFRDTISLSTELLLALSLVLTIAAIGGKVVAAVAAVVASLLVNWFYVAPYHTFTIAEAENIVSLFVFLAVAMTVGSLVDIASRRALEARRARLEAEALARSTASLAADPEPLPRLLDQLHTTFDLTGVRIQRNESGQMRTLASAGDVEGSPTSSIPLPSMVPGSQEQATLQVFGRTLSVDDNRLLRALADQLGVAVDNRRLMAEAAEAANLADVDAVRTALLRAVSHDLRTPLASIKAMISGLRDPAVTWTDDQLAEALETVDQETDRLNGLVGNLLDASRLQIGALAVDVRYTYLTDTVNSALHSLNIPDGSVEIAIAPDAAAVMSDPVLLERSLANVISNALRHAPPQHPVRVEAGVVGDVVHLRVVDRGLGIPAADRARVTKPFQQLGDQRTNDDGVGLGFSIAQGFVEAMHGSFALDDTPGGGLTVTIILPRAAEPAT